MIISFFGHSTLAGVEDLSVKIKKVICENLVFNENIYFYCGGYGEFDNLCAKICREIKKTYPCCEVVFVTPYITESQQKKIKCFLEEKLYDSIIYPTLENVPMRFAISKRNEWMVNQSDIIIAYVKYTYGGAYKTLLYAHKHKKPYTNLYQGNYELY